MGSDRVCKFVSVESFALEFVEYLAQTRELLRREVLNGTACEDELEHVDDFRERLLAFGTQVPEFPKEVSKLLQSIVSQEEVVAVIKRPVQAAHSSVENCPAPVFGLGKHSLRARSCAS